MSSSKFRKRRQRKNKSNSKKIILLVALLAVAVTIIVAYNMLSNNISNEEEVIPEVTQMKALLETTKGDIVIQLRDDRPITTENFKNLVQQGVYDGTIFHRVMSEFMIQGGDPNGNGISDDGIPTILDEGLLSDNNRNNRATIAMANSGANTGSSQFFINLVDNNYLDKPNPEMGISGHPVFGTIIEGMDVVDKIGKVATNSEDKPLEDVILIRAILIN